MATTLDWWEKDPFFAAAEDVQDSADRLESVYRQWIQERKSTSKSAGGDEFVYGELKRDLHTALGTAKWQLEEIERAVRSNDEALSIGEDTRSRHSEFVLAIGNRISTMEKSLRETNLEAGEVGESTLTWVRLDEAERDELARFLSYPSFKGRKETPVPSAIDLKVGNELIRMNGEALTDSSKDSCHSNQLSSLHMRDEKVHSIRRSASCAGDISARTVTISSEGEDTSKRSSDDRPNLPPPRVLSFSALPSALDLISRMRWYKNGLRADDQHDVIESIPLRNHEPSRGIITCYERISIFMGILELSRGYFEGLSIRSNTVTVSK